MIAIPFPQIDPIALQIGPLVIRWYALAYIAGILIGISLMKRLNKLNYKSILTNDDFEDMMVWIVLGIIIGGRLGYVLFYDLQHAIHNPLWVLQTWKGGMSFHGGCAGLALSVYLFCRKQKLPFGYMADLIACVAPIGIFLGRISNFINGELYGRETSVPWAMIFPDGGPNPRHPSQLYEAFLEGALLEIILLTLFYKFRNRLQAGNITGYFFLGYAIFRTIVEQYRQPDESIGLLYNLFSMGQLLSAPMLILGLYLALQRRKNSVKQ